ncbi:MAG: SGNH/GDSL hydrolase family protein [Gaiellaceae bacterium]
MNERVVLCFGDSNTYGWIPGGLGRFARDVRWPGVLAAELGDGWHVIEEGLPGRTTVFDDPFRPGAMNGRAYLQPCLLTHEPVDVLVIFLGTNDLDPRYTVTADEIARGVAVLARVSATTRYRVGTPPRVLAVGLPRLAPEWYPGIAAKIEALPAALRAMADAEGFDVLELHELVAYSDVDGSHLDESAHRAVGEAVMQRIVSMF